MRTAFLLIACLFGFCFGESAECGKAKEVFLELLKKDHWAKGYEFLISAVILGDKKIKDLETGYYCEAVEHLECSRLDFYTAYECPNRTIRILNEYQRLEMLGNPNSGNAGQPLGTK